MKIDFTRAQALYQTRGIGGGEAVLGARPGLLVIDFTYGFTDPSEPLGSDYDSEVAVTADLIERMRTAGLPVFFSRNAFQGGRGAGAWRRKFPAVGLLVDGERATEIDARVAPTEQDYVYTKEYPSFFFATPLASDLTHERVDSLIVTGCTTSGCVRATVVDAVQHGYPTTVVQDAVADRDEAPHRANLFDMGAKYAEVVKSVDVMSALGTKDDIGQTKSMTRVPNS